MSGLSGRVAAYRNPAHELASRAWQLPLAVALAALAVAALGLGPATIPAIYLAAVAPELARVDLRERRLPNRIVVPGLVVGVVAAAVSWAATGVPPVVPLVAGVASGALFLLLGIAGGMGMGDVKLATLIGLASPTVLVVIAAPLAAFLLGGVVATVVMIARGRGARIAFGPYLLAGYVAALALLAALRA